MEIAGKKDFSLHRSRWYRGYGYIEAAEPEEHFMKLIEVLQFVHLLNFMKNLINSSFKIIIQKRLTDCYRQHTCQNTSGNMKVYNGWTQY